MLTELEEERRPPLLALFPEQVSRDQTRPIPRLTATDADSDTPSVQLLLPRCDVLSGVHESVEALSIDTGLLVMKVLIDEEVEKRAGKKGKHDPDRGALAAPVRMASSPRGRVRAWRSGARSSGVVRLEHEESN